MIYNVYKAFRVHEKKDISFRGITESITTTSVRFTRFLVGKGANTNIGTKTLAIYLDTLNKYKDTAQSSEVIAIYQETIDVIKDYVADRHLGFSIESTPGSYSPIWFQGWFKSALVILNLAMFGGINPITFDPLNPELFDRDPNTGLFQPHHLDASTKSSLQFSGILILDPIWHGRFAPLAKTVTGINLQKQLRDSIFKLMSINRDVTETDIMAVFGDLTIFNKKVVDWWTQNPDFATLLKDWNENRKMIREGRIYQFFEKNFQLSNGDNPVIDRFWLHARETFNSFLLLKDDYDLSYIFTEKDKEFLVRYFTLK